MCRYRVEWESEVSWFKLARANQFVAELNAFFVTKLVLSATGKLQD